MGKSNNLNNELKKTHQIEKKISAFFRSDEIQILKDMNDFFSKKIIVDFSSFLKKNINLLSYKIKTDFDNKNNIKNFRCINLIETSSKNKFFIIFSSNFLSIMINVLFGGSSNLQETNNEMKNITSSELSVNKQVITFITNRLFYTYKKFFCRKITCIKTQVFTDLKELNFDHSEIFLKTCFYFEINNTKTCFSLLSTVHTIKELNKKIVHPRHNTEYINIEKNIPCNISLSDIYDIKINIIVRIINIFISDNELNNLSVGSIILIKKPDKILGFLENKPIFFGNYKRFNEKPIIFIEEFINDNLDFYQDKESIRMHNIKKRSDNKNLIDTDKKSIQHEDAIKNMSYKSEKALDHQSVLLDTSFHVTVELGRSKIKIKDFLGFSKGSMLVLDKLIKEPLDIFINGQCIASGEIVYLENRYGLRITSIKKISQNTINASI